MSGLEIARQMTLLPYYIRYASSDCARICLDALCYSGSVGVPNRLGLLTNFVRAPAFLQFCSVCRISDLERYGETYWRRFHQLPGVVVCPEHGQILVQSMVPLRPRKCSAYVDATYATDEIGIYANKLSSRPWGLEKLTMIACRSRDILNGSIDSWPIESLPEAYLRGILQRGFGEHARPSIDRLIDAFISFWGEELLEFLGCSVDGKNCRWLPLILRNTKRSFHPLRHALLQLFIENMPNVRSSIPLRRAGPWKCPNPYAVHDVEFPIKAVKTSFARKENKTLLAECSCGFKFTFCQTSDIDPRMPVVLKRIKLGPTWAAAVGRLRREGCSTKEISVRLQIHRCEVVSLFKINGESEMAASDRAFSSCEAGAP